MNKDKGKERDGEKDKDREKDKGKERDVEKIKERDREKEKIHDKRKPSKQIEETTYDLAGRDAAGPSMLGAEKIYTDEEKEALLQNYFEVPRELWRELPFNGWFRYINNEGMFYKGGVVKSVSADEYLTYGWVGSPAYKKVFFKDTAKIYKKYAYGAGIEIGMLINSIKNLTEHVKKQKLRLDELERRAGVTK